MRRPRVILLALGALALVLSGCSDDGERDDVTAGGAGTAASAGTEPAGAAAGGDRTCADLDASVLDQVEGPGPEDRRPEDAPPDPAEVEAVEVAEEALGRLADEGPEELRADAAAVAVRYDLDRPDPGDQVEEEADAAGARLVAWGAEHCEVLGPVWRCLRRGTFRLVGAPIDGTPNPNGGDTPEDVVADADVDGDRVEVERTDERVTFAWLDADGLAIRSETAAAHAGGWSSDQTTECDLFDARDEGFEPIPESLPPPQSSAPAEASSTSIP